jgi:hypothetical protein
LAILVSIIAAFSVSETPTTPVPSVLKILAIANSQQSIPDEVGKALQVSAYNRAISGASFYGVIDDAELINVKDQYEPSNLDWVLMSASGNGVNDKCNCNVCGDVINGIISSDATTGELSNLVNQVKQNGYKMVFVMYLQILIDAEYEFNQCGEEFSEVELRIKPLAVNTTIFVL